MIFGGTMADFYVNLALLYMPTLALFHLLGPSFWKYSSLMVGLRGMKEGGKKN